jgi:23S rRNA G2445 N2-methylase RlmL
MCGSGTILIEAALIAHRTAPGIGRSFQFMNWPSFDPRMWNELVDKAKDSVVKGPRDIQGADRDAGAVQSAVRNAERAGVAQDINFSTESVSGSFAALEDVVAGEGWIITNPPYGVRVGESGDLRNLYATLGSAVSLKHGWRIGVLVADDSLAAQMRLKLRARFETTNGGIAVRYLVSEKSDSPARQRDRVVIGAKDSQR